MTGNNFLLDTNIVIEIFKGNQVIADLINELPEFQISSIVLGELHIGINRASNKSKHTKKLSAFLEFCTVIDVDGTTSEYYGAIVDKLYKKAKPIPTNDIWIAASAIQHNLTLVTADKHLKEIENIKLEYVEIPALLR